MKKALIFIFTIFLFLFNSFSYAQNIIKLSKPRLELKDNQINIFFDILNSKETDKFKTRVEISDSSGNKIDARSLSGDIGKNVSGGNNRLITWDLMADSIYLDAGIYVQIYAEKLTPSEIAKPEINISRGGIISQSILFPGWGLSRINKGKPHWLKGVAGYGCITASVIYNKKAVTSYNAYLNSSDMNEGNKFFENSIKEDKMSEVFAYAAIGIWVADIIWTIAATSDLKKGHEYSQTKGFSINTVYVPNLRAQIVAVRYNF